jgi:Fe-S-cluster containining protein
MGNFDFTSYKSRTRDRMVRQCLNEKDLDGMLDELQQAASEAEATIALHRFGDRSLIACGPGCSGCCVVNVSTLLPEGIAIARYVRQQSPEHEQEIFARLDSLWCEIRGLEDEDRLFMRRTCGFLDEQGRCEIYPVRPLLCRSVTSTDANSCREALAGKIFGEDKPVLMHQFQQAIYETLFAGIAEGLEATGIDGRSYQLTGLVRFLLQNPAAESGWLCGKRLSWQDIY